MVGNQGKLSGKSHTKATPQHNWVGFLDASAAPALPCWHWGCPGTPAEPHQWTLGLPESVFPCSALITDFSFKTQLADPRPHASTLWLGGGERGKLSLPVSVVGAGPASHQCLTGEFPRHTKGSSYCWISKNTVTET